MASKLSHVHKRVYEKLRRSAATKKSDGTLVRRNISFNHGMAAMLIVAVIALGSLVSYNTMAASRPNTNITVSGKASGPVFDGLGAISGGGGNSRLLIDYPEPQRSQILDYLFKPNYGAGIELLKLEIGGDSNSSDGSEASIEHAKGQINCSSGYEWWLAEQAVARNPKIKLYGLQWAAPGWTGNGAQTIWSVANVGYVMDWMNCAKSHHLTISYLGGWNERMFGLNSSGFSAAWYEKLRGLLNARGFSSTTLVAADQVQGAAAEGGPWAVASSMASNAAFRSAVGVVGVHDTCPSLPTTGYTCTATKTARSIGKPLWESELGRMDANTGAADMDRAVLNGYIQAGLTGFLEWPAVDSMPTGLPYENRGFVTADQPWAGNYVVNRMTWAIAQIAQFVPAGWHYVGNANKVIGNSGSYNTLQAPNHSAWSLIAQNTSAYKGQNVGAQGITVNVSGGLPNAVVHVWQTNLWSAHPSDWFVRQSDIHPKQGKFTYVIQPGSIVSFTTTSGQSKGGAVPRTGATLTLPYRNSLTTDDGSDEPAMLSPQEGSFQMASCLGGVSGKCTQQLTPADPIQWTNATVHYPYAVIGSGGWSNYTISSDVLFTQANASGGVIGRFSARSSDGMGFDGYLFHVAANGKWALLKNFPKNGPTPVTLASGTVAPPGRDTWHTVSLSLKGSKLTGSIDGRPVGSANDSSYGKGAAGIEAGAFSGGTWPLNEYRNLSVTGD
jgi:hypothetical protein